LCKLLVNVLSWAFCNCSQEELGRRGSIAPTHYWNWH
jgi:hypothetical protein